MKKLLPLLLLVFLAIGAHAQPFLFYYSQITADAFRGAGRHAKATREERGRRSLKNLPSPGSPQNLGILPAPTA